MGKPEKVSVKSAKSKYPSIENLRYEWETCASRAPMIEGCRERMAKAFFRKTIKKEIKNMQKKCKKKLLSLILSTMLIVAMAFSMTACGGNDTEKPNTENLSGGTEQDSQEGDVQGGSITQTDTTVLGKGASVFGFTVVDKDGKETKFEIHTDKITVGDALLEVELIEGEEGAYGLYVKKVNGITADYDVDQTYWAFYINGEMAMTGVDATNVEAGATYSFKVEK